MSKVYRSMYPKKEWFPVLVEEIRKIKHIDKFECYLIGSYSDLIHGYDVYSYDSGRDVDISLTGGDGVHNFYLRSVLKDIHEMCLDVFNTKFDAFWTQGHTHHTYHKLFSDWQRENLDQKIGTYPQIPTRSIHYVKIINEKSPEQLEKIPKHQRKQLERFDSIIDGSGDTFRLVTANWLWECVPELPTQKWIKKFHSRRKNPEFRRRVIEKGSWATTDLLTFDLQKWEEEQYATSSKNW